MRIALAFLLVGCVAYHGPADDDGVGSGSGSGSGSDDTVVPPPPTVPNGAYQVRSNIDVTVEVLLPEQVEDKVVTLRNFSTNPARALFDLAEEAGVPAVGELRAALPDYLEGKLEEWINAEIAKLTIDGVPVTVLAGNIAALAETALTQFALDSELSIAGSIATHTLKTLDFSPSGLNRQIPLGDLPAEIGSATTTCSAQNSGLRLGDHAYGLPYGEYVWRAVNDQMTVQYGYDVHSLLGAAVNCPALAHTIAGKCYLGVCVGHEAELTTICERGLDEVVGRMHAKLAELRFDAIHFEAGTAKLVDTDNDSIADRIDQGVWTAEINAGLGLRPVPATFTATR